MGVRKVDLREFVTNKADKRKNEIWEAARIIAEAAIRPIIFDKFKGVEPVERLGQQFYDALLDSEINKLLPKWRVDNLMRDINHDIIGARSEKVKKYTTTVLHNLLRRCTDGLPEEVNAIVPRLKEHLAKHMTEYQELMKLTEELTTIIDSCHNGDKAYKRLDELGVDLSGFKMSSPNLPAVVKLSANVCVLNGNC